MTEGIQKHILVVGGSGATGRLLIEQLLERGARVRTIVRARGRLPEPLRDHPQVEVVEAALLDLSDAELQAHVEGCTGIASCLGHNLSFGGMFGPPYRLVRDAVQRLCAAARAQGKAEPIRFVLMGSSGVRNHDLGEKVSLAQRIVLAILRVLVPPHADNEQAADVLRVGVGQGEAEIEWCVVRPDSLINQDTVEPYELVASPTRSAIFDAGKVSRIQVAHAMAELLLEDDLWNQWQGRMPVLYGRDS